MVSVQVLIIVLENFDHLFVILARRNTPTYNFFHAEDKFYRNLNYRVHVMINEPLDFSQTSVQDDVAEFLRKLSSLKYLDSKFNLTESWLGEFQKSRKIFKTFYKFFRANSRTSIPLNVHQIEDEIYISRYMVQTTDIKDATEEAHMLESLRSIETPFNVTFFHPYFPYFDQFLQVKTNTLTCLGASITVVLFTTVVLIPDPKAAISLVIAMASIMTMIGGFMYLLQIYLDVISMITLIMSVGFSVDFCVHLCHHFYSR